MARKWKFKWKTRKNNSKGIKEDTKNELSEDLEDLSGKQIANFNFLSPSTTSSECIWCEVCSWNYIKLSRASTLFTIWRLVRLRKLLVSTFKAYCTFRLWDAQKCGCRLKTYADEQLANTETVDCSEASNAYEKRKIWENWKYLGRIQFSNWKLCKKCLTFHSTQPSHAPHSPISHHSNRKLLKRNRKFPCKKFWLLFTPKTHQTFLMVFSEKSYLRSLFSVLIHKFSIFPQFPFFFSSFSSFFGVVGRNSENFYNLLR